jgi:hypothetical protein
VGDVGETGAEDAAGLRDDEHPAQQPSTITLVSSSSQLCNSAAVGVLSHFSLSHVATGPSSAPPEVSSLAVLSSTAGSESVNSTVLSHLSLSHVPKMGSTSSAGCSSSAWSPSKSPSVLVSTFGSKGTGEASVSRTRGASPRVRPRAPASSIIPASSDCAASRAVASRSADSNFNSASAEEVDKEVDVSLSVPCALAAV